MHVVAPTQNALETKSQVVYYGMPESARHKMHFLILNFLFFSWQVVYYGMPESLSVALETANIALTTYFGLEMALKVLHFFLHRDHDLLKTYLCWRRPTSR